MNTAERLHNRCVRIIHNTTTHNKEPKPQSGTSRVLQNTSPGLRGHEGSLHLFIQCRKLNFGTQVVWDIVHDPHHVQEPKPQSGTSRVFQNLSPGLQGHEGT